MNNKAQNYVSALSALMENTRLLCAIFAALFLITACSSRRESDIRIGVKNFDEQKIIANLAAQLLQGHGYTIEKIHNCNDTYECHRALHSGKIDLMVEYTGTGLVFMGKPIKHETDALKRLRNIYKELGLTWLGPLGFDNSYRVLVRMDRASARQLKTIEDLAKIQGNIRIACPAEYLRRPGDGLYALLRVHGLKNKMVSKPLLLDDPEKRYKALLDGKVDVAIGYATDGSIHDPRLTVLEDREGFFPKYEAAFLISNKTLSRHTGIKGVLKKLENRISTEKMRTLNYKVQTEGRSSQSVAEVFLHDLGLPTDQTHKSRKRAELTVTKHVKDNFFNATKLASHAVRQAFPKRAVRIARSSTPKRDLVRGNTRLAILGSERFFIDKNGKPTASRDDRIEAIAVLETRVLHLFRRADDNREPGEGRIGIEEKESGSALVAQTVLKSKGRKHALNASPKELFEQLANRGLDGVLIMAPLQDPMILESMKKNSFKLTSLDNWITPKSRSLLVYLRRRKIPQSTYSNQPDSINSFSSQVVLAGPSPKLGYAGGGGGQAAALPVHGLPIPRKEMLQIVEATGHPEPPDSVLPSAWITIQEDTEEITKRFSIGTKILNACVIAFLIWLAWIIVRKEPKPTH